MAESSLQIYLMDGPEFAPSVASISSSKSSHLERSGKLKPRMGFSSKEPFPGGRGSNNDDVTNKDYRVLDATVAWETDGSCRMTMSPGFEEWKNKKLGQSLKDGCSRSVRSSRSRSPPHGFMWDSGVNDKNRASAGRFTQPCRDFAAGNCRRGSHCHFLHLGNQNFEDSWESRHRQDGAPRYSAVHESGDYSLTSGRSDEACINFLKGRCRMGASCKYVHHDNSDEFGKVSADESSRDWVINRRHMENSFEQGGWHYPNHIGDTPCKFFAFGNCRNGKHCRFSHDRQACRIPNRRLSDDRTRINQGGDQVLDRPKLSDSDTPNGRIRDDRWCSDGSMAAVDKVWDGPTKNHLVAVFDTAKLVEDDKNGVMSFTAWPMSDGWGHNLDKNRVHGESPFSSYKKEANCWTAENAIDNIRISQSVDRSIWPGDEKMSPDWNYGERSSSRIKEKHRQNKQQVSPGQGYNHAARNVNALHSSSYHGVVESRLVHSIAVPRLRTEGMQNQEVSTEKRYTVESIASLSQVGSRNHPTHMVSKEQLAQLTCLSASLAHFLGAGRQLLQLNTCSSSHDTKGVPSVDQTEGSGDPMSDSMETSGVPQTFSPIENVPNDAVEIPSLLSNSGQNFDDFCKTAFSSEFVKSENEIAAGENDPLEDMEKSGGPDEANKIKDVKGIRAFKFSLVEYIKELLKPTWKEGQITKEDYKAIVKKVTDKVTGSVQREHIPQTQDKIDRYLSFSKPKLNKLVQAYLEKVRKA